jgi:hypothetical protein
MELIRQAAEADVRAGFAGCTQEPGAQSGELKICFGQAGQIVLQGVPIVTQGKSGWTENAKYRITGVEIAPGGKSFSHFFPLIGE